MALDDPAVEVSIGGVAAPLFFVSPTQINAQVPWEVEAGWTEVVVRRGGEASPALPLRVFNTQPSLFTQEGTNTLIIENDATAQKPSADRVPRAITGPTGGSSAADSASAAITSGATLTVFGVGLGVTDPPAVTGATTTGSAPTAPQEAYWGGLPAEIVSGDLSTELVGVYGLRIKVPELGESGEVLHWLADGRRGAGIVGTPKALAPRYMSVPTEASSAQRLDMPDLNPYFVALSGTPDESDSCFRNTVLLDYRRDKTTTLNECLLPSYPFAPNPARYRPFELAVNTPALAALAEPSASSSSGVTDRMIVIDSATDSIARVSLEHGADRLQSGFGGSSDLRLERPGGTGQRTLIDPAGARAGEVVANAPLPNPLVFENLTRVVAQPANLAGGYRMRFLGPESSGASKAVLYNRRAQVAGSLAFPTGWTPLIPARAVNNQGAETGIALAPATTGFRDDLAVYVLARAADGTRDAVVTFRPQLPSDLGATPPATVAITAAVTEFPTGAFAASCAPVASWQRIELTRKLAIIAASTKRTEFARRQENQICAGDRLLLFDTVTSETSSISAPGALEVAAEGALQSYLYFGDGGSREVALQVPRKVYVFDGVTETFGEIDFPGNTGVTLDRATQHLPSETRVVALATGGQVRRIPIRERNYLRWQAIGAC